MTHVVVPFNSNGWLFPKTESRFVFGWYRTWYGYANKLENIIIIIIIIQIKSSKKNFIAASAFFSASLQLFLGVFWHCLDDDS